MAPRPCRLADSAGRPRWWWPPWGVDRRIRNVSTSKPPAATAWKQNWTPSWPGSTSLPGLERPRPARIAHLWFVTLHPLADGNGRLARTLTDLALAQDEQSPRRFFSLSVEILRNKEAYYDALERAQRGTSTSRTG